MFFLQVNFCFYIKILPSFIFQHSCLYQNEHSVICSRTFLHSFDSNWFEENDFLFIYMWIYPGICVLSNMQILLFLQILIAIQFLLYDPVSYLMRSFELGRVFLFKWTVNWRFLSEEIFLDKRLHLSLLGLHLLILGIFGYFMWFRYCIYLLKSILDSKMEPRSIF